MKKATPKNPTKTELARTEQLKQEIYTIFHEAANQYYKMMEKRDETLQNRLNAIELMGMPENPLQEIKTAISQIRYSQHQLKKGFIELLSFFNMSKDMFNEVEPKTTNPIN